MSKKYNWISFFFLFTKKILFLGFVDKACYMYFKLIDQLVYF